MAKFSRTAREEGLLQFVAGVGLIDATRLLRWSTDDHQFVLPASSSEFVNHWIDFDPAFGRAAFWNVFSTGAELLLKGALLANDQEIRKVLDILKHPVSLSGSEFDEWVYRCSIGSLRDEEKEKTVSYGHLGEAIKKFRAWKGISKTAASTEPECNLIVAAFDLLRSSIRNRDTHAYVPNVRANHIRLVEGLFLPAFNACVRLIPDAHELTRLWLARADQRPQPTVAP